MLAFLDGSFPAVGGMTAVIIVLAVVLFRIITDRSAVKSQIDGLTVELELQRTAHHALETHVSVLEELYNDERSLKHQAFNDVARALVALQVVRRLADECSCGALASLGDVITQVLGEMETANRRRRPPTYPDAIPPAGGQS